MPFLSYFAVAGSALLGLLFVADAVLPERRPLSISSEFHGVSATLQNATGSIRAPWEPDLPGLAPAPDMTSAAVKRAREGTPQPAASPNVEPVNRPVARAEPAVPKKRKQVVRSREWREHYAQADDGRWNWGSNNRSSWRNHYWRNESWHRDVPRNDWRGDHWRTDSWRTDSWR